MLLHANRAPKRCCRLNVFVASAVPIIGLSTSGLDLRAYSSCLLTDFDSSTPRVRLSCGLPVNEFCEAMPQN
jgi:hypothetical protein